MKCSIPEISWHNREPVLSVDLHPVFKDFYRLASAGGDCHVLIWSMNLAENGGVKLEVISDLTRHQRAVNCVRWSPSGAYLASADDDANIIVWSLKLDQIPLLEGDSPENKETYNVFKVLRGHKEDIYDLCWSMDEMKIFSGSVDNTAILWNLQKGKMEQILSDHKGFVQGVAWDPKNQFLASISTDRTLRLFDVTGKHVKARIFKGLLPVQEQHLFHKKDIKFFHDDTFKSFFRRLQFTPDGSLLVVPSGHFEDAEIKETLNGTLLFTLDKLTSPQGLLPLNKQSSTVVRCCPMLFELRPDGPEALVDLPYRMIIAVGTDHDVILYDTQQKAPFARFHEIHYTRLTDLTWSHDGLLLVASSTDGFCALITFEPQELGIMYKKPEEKIPEKKAEEKIPENKLETKQPDEETPSKKEKRKSFLEKWALNPPATKKNKLEEPTTKKRIIPLKIGEVTKVKLKPVKKKTSIVNFLTPKSLIDEENLANDAWKCTQNEDVVDLTSVDEEDKTEEGTWNLDKILVEDEKKEEEKAVKRRIPLITLSSPKGKQKNS